MCFAKIRLTAEHVTRELRSGAFRVKQTYPFVIPKPGSSARNLLVAGSKTADYSRDEAALRNDKLLGILEMRHYPYLELRDYIPDPRGHWRQGAFTATFPVSSICAADRATYTSKSPGSTFQSWPLTS